MKLLHYCYFKVNRSVPVALFLAEDVIPKFDSGNICDHSVTVIQRLVLFTETIQIVKSMLFLIMCLY